MDGLAGDEGALGPDQQADHGGDLLDIAEAAERDRPALALAFMLPAVASAQDIPTVKIGTMVKKTVGGGQDFDFPD